MRRRALLAGLAAGLTAVAGCSAPSGDRSTPRPPDELPPLPGEQPTIWNHDLPADAPAVLRPETSTFDAETSEMPFVFENRSSAAMAVPEYDALTCYRLGEQRWHRIPRAVMIPVCRTTVVRETERLTLYDEGYTSGSLDEMTEMGTGRFACTVASGPAEAVSGCLSAATTAESVRRYATTFSRE